MRASETAVVDLMEVRAAVRRRRPGLPVLLISGYSHDVVANAGALDSGIKLLQKPFTPQQLLAEVEEQLAAYRQPKTNP